MIFGSGRRVEIEKSNSMQAGIQPDSDMIAQLTKKKSQIHTDKSFRSLNQLILTVSNDTGTSQSLWCKLNQFYVSLKILREKSLQTKANYQKDNGHRPP